MELDLPNLPFTAEQLYGVDSVGVAVSRRALPETVVATLLRAIDERAGPRAPAKLPVMELGPAFLELMCHPWILAACERLLGGGFRFDHAFCVTQPGSGANLHGGPNQCQGSVYWRYGGDGRIASGRLTVGVSLAPQDASTGGMCYIPGSHKSAYWMHGGEVLSKMLKGNLASELVVVPTLGPGDIHLFPDCLVHGATDWKGKHVRRTIYLMYSPGFMAWRPHAEIERLAALARTETQRRLLRPPYVASYEDRNGALGENRWRGPTR